MREELLVALEERVTRLIGEYQRLQADHADLKEQVSQMAERQQSAVARIDALLQKVQDQ
jgi:FtsZ-binding cell division protein ZapB